MNQIRRELAKRLEHEATQMHSWMRQDQERSFSARGLSLLRPGPNQISPKEQIDVDRPRAVTDRGHASHRVFDFEERSEQVGCAQGRLRVGLPRRVFNRESRVHCELHNLIQKPGLLVVFDRFGFIDRRSPGYCELRGRDLQGSCFCYGLVKIRLAVAQVRSKANVHDRAEIDDIFARRSGSCFVRHVLTLVQQAMIESESNYNNGDNQQTGSRTHSRASLLDLSK